ncbi:MAG TPA: hypothetical protein VFZ66_00955, partial [Herpetosiphonaceae bacterium]
LSSDTRPDPLVAGTQESQPEAAPTTAPQPTRAILLAAGAIGMLLLALMIALALWWRHRARRAVAATDG